MKTISHEQKDFLSKWAPLVVALITNAVVVAYGYGKLEQRMAPIEIQLSALAHDKLSVNYVTRSEFTMRTQQRDREMERQSEWLNRIEAKLDRVLERQNGRSGNAQ